MKLGESDQLPSRARPRNGLQLKSTSGASNFPKAAPVLDQKAATSCGCGISDWFNFFSLIIKLAFAKLELMHPEDCHENEDCDRLPGRG